MKKKKKIFVDNTENNNEIKLDASDLEATEETADYQEQFLNPPSKKKTEETVENKDTDSKWNEEITLTPEEYEELDDGNGLKNTLPDSEEAQLDLSLGEANERADEEFQLTIHFDGSEESEKTAETKEERKYDPDKPRFMDWVFDIAEMFVFVLAAVMILTSFIFKHSVVEGNSMLNTLSDGDHLIISDLFYTPDYGHIVVFEDYSKDENYRKAVIKRVIGLPGDTVEIKVAEDGKTLKVYVNGEPIKDINLASKGQKEIMDLAWVLAIFHQMKLGKTYPLKLDEPDGGLNNEHRVRLLNFLQQMMQNEDLKQLFMINQFPSVYDSFISSQTLCIKEEGILLPAEYNQDIEIDRA